MICIVFITIFKIGFINLKGQFLEVEGNNKSKQDKSCSQLINLSYIMKIVIFVLLCCLAARQLKFIQVISRHGARQPLYPNNYDYSNISNHNSGALTIQGKSMHYFLGKFLYQKYWNLLFKDTAYQYSYDESIIYAKSTNTDRTIESLQCQIQGLLKNLKKTTSIEFSQHYLPPFNRNNKEKTISNKESQFIQTLFTFPIHVEQGAEGHHVANQHYQGDYLVKLFQNLCPNQKKWKQQNYLAPLAMKIKQNQKIRLAIDTLNTIYNCTNITIQNAYKYIDNYICLKNMNRQYLPLFEEPSIKEIFQFIYIEGLYLANFCTQQQRRTYSTTLIQKTILHIKEAIAGSGPKIVLYSGHDTTLGTLLTAMNFTNVECIMEKYLQGKNDTNCYYKYPTFASTFIFEMWEQNGHYLVNIVINGQKFKIPICNYSQQCTLQQFQAWFEGFKVKSPNQQCGIVGQQALLEQYYFHLIYFCIGFLLALTISKSTNKYSSGQRSKEHFQVLDSQ